MLLERPPLTHVPGIARRLLPLLLLVCCCTHSFGSSSTCSKAPGNLVASGDFETPACWSLVGAGSFDVVQTDGGANAARCIVHEAGADPFATSLIQRHLVSVERWRYRLVAEARASRDGLPLAVRLTTPDSTRGGAIISDRIVLGESWSRIVLEGAAATSSFDDTLAFGIGREAGEYWIRNVRLEMLADPPGTREKLKQPFSSRSIWNMPIGSDADFVPADFRPGEWAAIDVDYFIVTSDTDPTRSLFDNRAGWSSGRCDGSVKTGVEIHVPDTLLVPDVVLEPWPETPNNSAALLQPDGESLFQCNALARCERGGDVWGVPVRDRRGRLLPNESIYGEGIGGGHGGSLLSSIGGTIRRGELLSTEPIRHALKLDIPCRLYCYAGEPAYRWPAAKSDNCRSADCADSAYGGDNPALKMGALLAIPAAVSAESLRLETAVGRKLFRALQNYGAYLVDDSAWNAFQLCVEFGVREEVQAYYGYSIDTPDGSTPYFRDFHRVIQALHVVNDNSPQSVGGAGGPRDSLPELTPPVRDATTPTLAARTLKRGSVAFDIALPVASEVDLVLCGIDGRKIARLFHGPMQAGENVIEWEIDRNPETANIAAGVYWGRMRTSSGIATARVVVIR